MALDDLLKGLNSFQSGLQTLAQGMAVNDAREQLNQINGQVQNQAEKQQMAQQVGQDLAMRLTQAGASGEKIAGVTQGLIPSASNTQTMQAQKDMQQASFAQQTKEKGMDRDLALELQRMKTAALFGKTANKEKKAEGAFVTRYQEKFNKEGEKPRVAVQTMGQAEDILRSGNPIGDASIGAMFARAAGDVGNLSEYEQKNYGGSKAILTRIAQIQEQWKSGKMSDENRKFMLQLAGTYKAANQRKLEEIADRYANQASQAASRAGFENDPEDLRTAITGSPRQQPAASPPAAGIKAKIDAAKAWLADPANANSPKRKAAEDKIKQLESMK